jgi:hypothetical protein
MIFPELEAARSKRAAKDRAVTDKKKLGRKWKNAAMEDDAASPTLEDEGVRIGELLGPTQRLASPWMAPVARMNRMPLSSLLYRIRYFLLGLCTLLTREDTDTVMRQVLCECVFLLDAICRLN